MLLGMRLSFSLCCVDLYVIPCLHFSKIVYNESAVDGFIACLRIKLRLWGLRICAAPKTFMR